MKKKRVRQNSQFSAASAKRDMTPREARRKLARWEAKQTRLMDPSPVVPAASDGTPERTEDLQNHTDDEQHGTQLDQDGSGNQPPDDQQNNA